MTEPKEVSDDPAERSLGRPSRKKSQMTEQKEASDDQSRKMPQTTQQKRSLAERSLG